MYEIFPGFCTIFSHCISLPSFATVPAQLSPCKGTTAQTRQMSNPLEPFLCAVGTELAKGCNELHLLHACNETAAERCQQLTSSTAEATCQLAEMQRRGQHIAPRLEALGTLEAQAWCCLDVASHVLQWAEAAHFMVLCR